MDLGCCYKSILEEMIQMRSTVCEFLEQMGSNKLVFSPTHVFRQYPMFTILIVMEVCRRLFLWNISVPIYLSLTKNFNSGNILIDIVPELVQATYIQNVILFYVKFTQATDLASEN